MYRRSFQRMICYNEIVVDDVISLKYNRFHVSQNNFNISTYTPIFAGLRGSRLEN